MDIAWLAGLLEGEGWFGLKDKKWPVIGLQMTDCDIVIRAAFLLGVKSPEKPYYWKRKNHKPTWKCGIYGSRAIGWMMTLYQFLGERRREKIRFIIEQWKKMTSHRAPRGIHWTATCHPDKRIAGMGLCQTCYMRKYRAHGPLIGPRPRKQLA
jgi:hypothetical protein